MRALLVVVALAVAGPVRPDTAARGWRLEDWATGLGPVTDLAFPGSRREVGRIVGMPVSFKVGPDGAVYVAVLPGRIVRISPAP